MFAYTHLPSLQKELAFVWSPREEQARVCTAPRMLCSLFVGGSCLWFFRPHVAAFLPLSGRAASQSVSPITLSIQVSRLPSVVLTVSPLLDTIP